MFEYGQQPTAPAKLRVKVVAAPTLRRLFAQLNLKLGARIIGLSSLGIALAWLGFGGPDELAFGTGKTLSVTLAIIALLSLLPLLSLRSALGWVGPGLLWFAIGLVGAINFARDPALTAAVEPLEGMVAVLAILAIVSGPRASVPFALMTAISAGVLVLFGTIHIVNASDISGLLPDWMPFASIVPYATGATLVIAGLAIASATIRPIAAYVISLMFLSWLPLIHFERLAKNPASAAEWQFALTALALSGVLMLIGDRWSRTSANSGEN